MPPSPPTLQQKANFEYAVVASLVLVSWELLVHAFEDLNYLRRFKALYRKPRYGALTVIVAQSNIRLGKGVDCHAAGLVSLIVGGVFVPPPISLIYFLAIWDKKPFVKWILIGLWIALIGASMTAPFSQSANNLPTGGCTITRSERYTPASFIANAVYDCVVFILTIIKLVMTTRLVNNVFHILRKDEVGPHLVSGMIGHGQSAKSAIVFGAPPRAPAGKSNTMGSVIVVGSGVGTNYFDNVSSTAQDTSDEESQTEASAKYTTKGISKHTYPLPLDARSHAEVVTERKSLSEGSIPKQKESTG